MKWSNFHITVNYNIDGEEHIDQMRQAIENMAESPYLWQWLKHYNGGKHDFSPENKLDVESVRIRAAFEHGGQQNHGLHAHILIEVGHRTMVQVEKQGVIDVFREVLPDNNPNIHIRFVRGDGEDKVTKLFNVPQKCTAHTLLGLYPPLYHQRSAPLPPRARS